MKNKRGDSPLFSNLFNFLIVVIFLILVVTFLLSKWVVLKGKFGGISYQIIDLGDISLILSAGFILKEPMTFDISPSDTSLVPSI